MLSPQRHDCDMCERSFPTLSSLKQHYSSTHRKGQGGFSCYICDRKYTQISNLCRHMRHDHPAANSTTQRHHQTTRASSRSSSRSHAQQGLDHCNGIDTKVWLDDSGLPSFAQNSSIENTRFSWPFQNKWDQPSVEPTVAASPPLFPLPSSFLSSPSNPPSPLLPFPWMLNSYVPSVNPIVMADLRLRLMYDTIMKSMASSYSDVIGARTRDERSFSGNDSGSRNCSAEIDIRTMTSPTTNLISKMADSERRTRSISNNDCRLDSDFVDVTGTRGTRMIDNRTDDHGALDLRLVQSPDNLVGDDAITPAWSPLPTTVSRTSENLDESQLNRSLSPRDASFSVIQRDRDSPTVSGLPAFSAFQVRSLQHPSRSPVGRLRTTRDDGLSSKSVCQFCGAELAGTANLKRHMRIHTGERPYQCIHCGRLFSISSNLKRHVISVHKMASRYRRDH